MQLRVQIIPFANHLKNNSCKEGQFEPDESRLTHFYNEIAKNSKGAAIKNVASVKILKEIKVPLASIEKQKEIICFIDELETNTTNLLEIFNKKLSNLEEFKKSILQKAFAGELTNKTIEV